MDLTALPCFPAMVNWNELWKSLSQGQTQMALLWSAISLALAVGVFLFLRKWLWPESLGPLKRRSRRRMVLLGIALMLILLWLRIWTTSTLLPSDYASVEILQSIVWNIVLAVMLYVLVKTIQRRMLRNETEIATRHKIRAALSWLGILLFLVATFFIWAGRLHNFGVFLGIIGAGLALSMGETLLCIAGWGILAVRKPYDIGDRIEIDGRIGDVIHISIFQTTMLEVGNWVEADQSTGRLTIFPNSMIMRKAVFNYTKGFPFIWNEFSTIVSFESDWKLAKDIMFATADLEDRKIESEVHRQIQNMQSHYAIRYEKLAPIVYTSVADNGIRLTLRFLSPVRQRRAMTHRISEGILEAFIQHEAIDFAYPTTRFFHHAVEGKPQLRAEPTTQPGVQPDQPMD